jgi:hypothetical protein
VPVVTQADGDVAAVAQAPADATLVIYHTSALWHLSAEQRGQFADTVRGLGATWLSSEPLNGAPRW